MATVFDTSIAKSVLYISQYVILFIATNLANKIFQCHDSTVLLIKCGFKYCSYSKSLLKNTKKNNHNYTPDWQLGLGVK